MDGFKQHALNNGKISIELKNCKRVTVYGYCHVTNCVYEFHGCFYHGCPAYYESSASTPHRVHKASNH